MPRLEAMKEYWQDNPPIHQLVAGYMGYKPEEKPQQGSMEDLIAALGGVKNGKQ